jgi:hypothetical protein
MKNISDVYPSYEDATDVRFLGPTHECPCGSNIWNVKTVFEDYEISQYFLDMECAFCGTKGIAPTPIDRPDEAP